MARDISKITRATGEVQKQYDEVMRGGIVDQHMRDLIGGGAVARAIRGASGLDTISQSLRDSIGFGSAHNFFEELRPAYEAIGLTTSGLASMQESWRDTLGFSKGLGIADRMGGFYAKDLLDIQSTQDQLSGIASGILNQQSEIQKLMADIAIPSVDLGLDKTLQDELSALTRAYSDQINGISQTIESIVKPYSAEFAALAEMDLDSVDWGDPDFAEEVENAVEVINDPASKSVDRWLAAIGILIGLASFLFPDFSDEDRQKLDDLHETSEQTQLLGETILQILQSGQRAYVLKQAYVRENPSGKSTRIAKLHDGHEVVIVARDGRWRRIVYMTDVLEEREAGWVWYESLEVME